MSTLRQHPQSRRNNVIDTATAFVSQLEWNKAQHAKRLAARRIYRAGEAADWIRDQDVVDDEEDEQEVGNEGELPNNEEYQVSREIVAQILGKDTSAKHRQTQLDDSLDTSLHAEANRDAEGDEEQVIDFSALAPPDEGEVGMAIIDMSASLGDETAGDAFMADTGPAQPAVSSRAALRERLRKAEAEAESGGQAPAMNADDNAMNNAISTRSNYHSNEEEGEEEDEDEDEDEDEEDEEDPQARLLREQRALVKPVFISKAARDALVDKKTRQEQEKEMERKLAELAAKKKAESRAMLISEVQRAEMEEERRRLGLEGGTIPDDRDLPEEQEKDIAAWKQREFLRTYRERQARAIREAEEAERERWSNLTAKEREAERMAQRAKRAQEQKLETEKAERKRARGAAFYTDGEVVELLNRRLEGQTHSEWIASMSKKSQFAAPTGLRGQQRHTDIREENTYTKDSIWSNAKKYDIKPKGESHRSQDDQEQV